MSSENQGLWQKIKWWLPRFYVRTSKSSYATPVLSMIFLLGFIVGSKLIYYEYITIAPCGIRERMGMPCPGCGGTRTTIAFFNGQLLKSLTFNPLVWVFCMTWSLQALNIAFYRFMGRRIHVRWRYLSYRTKFVLATFVFVFNWFIVTQLSFYWIE